MGTCSRGCELIKSLGEHWDWPKPCKYCLDSDAAVSLGEEDDEGVVVLLVVVDCQVTVADFKYCPDASNCNPIASWSPKC